MAPTAPNRSVESGAQIIQGSKKDRDDDNQLWTWKGDSKSGWLRVKSSGLVQTGDAHGQATPEPTDERTQNPLWRVVEVKN